MKQVNVKTDWMIKNNCLFEINVALSLRNVRKQELIGNKCSVEAQSMNKEICVKHIRKWKHQIKVCKEGMIWMVSKAIRQG